MLTNKQKKILEDKIYEIAKKRINEWNDSKQSDGGKSKVKDIDLGKKSDTNRSTVLNWLDDDTVNKAAVAYELAGVQSAGEDKKAAARSIFYKKLNNRKNDNGVEYEFNPKEINKIASILGNSDN